MILKALITWVAFSFANAAIAETAENTLPDAAFGVVMRGERTNYEVKIPGSNFFDLVVRDKSGVRTIIDGLRGSNTRSPSVIQCFMISPDGDKVSVTALSSAKPVSLSVYDAAMGIQLAGPITGVQMDIASWSEDSHTLYFTRRQTSGTGDISLMAWNLQSVPATVQTYDASVVSLTLRKKRNLPVIQKRYSDVESFGSSDREATEGGHHT
jgi:WD40 repeat protein